MVTYTKTIFSQSTAGRGIKIGTTGTAGTLIHVPPTGTTDYDEIWIYAVNSDSSSIKMTVEFGGVTSPDDTIEVTIPAENGLILTIPGLVVQNSAPVRVFAAREDVLLVHGFINRITA
jgi:hypothetical protein